MILRIFTFLCLSTSLAHSQSAKDIEVALTNTSGDNYYVYGFERVTIPQFALKDTGLSSKDVSAYCTKQWPAAIAEIRGILYALDERAISDLGLGLKIKLDGAERTIQPITTASSPLVHHPDAIKWMVERTKLACGHGVPATTSTKKLNGMDAAKILCTAIDNGGFASQPCEIDLGNYAIKVWLDLAQGRAEPVCRELASVAAEKKLPFERGWKLEIYSPYSGGNTTAYCAL